MSCGEVSAKGLSCGFLIRAGLVGCRRFGIAAAPSLDAIIWRAEASLQNRPFQPLEDLFVLRAGAPPLPGSGRDGSKLCGVAAAISAHQEVSPDQRPFGPSGVDQLFAGNEACNFFTARHLLWLDTFRFQAFPQAIADPMEKYS